MGEQGGGRGCPLSPPSAQPPPPDPSSLRGKSVCPGSASGPQASSIIATCCPCHLPETLEEERTRPPLRGHRPGEARIPGPCG